MPTVQANRKIPVDVNKMNIDLMSISGHKIYGHKVKNSLSSNISGIILEIRLIAPLSTFVSSRFALMVTYCVAVSCMTLIA